MTKSQFIRTWTGTSIIVALAAWLCVGIVGARQVNSYLVALSFALIGCISAYNLVRSNTTDGISLAVIFWFFNFVFFAVTPYLKYLTGGFEYPLSEASMLFANLLILLYLLIFQLCYSYKIKSAARLSRHRGSDDARFAVRLRHWRLLVAIALSLVIAVALIARDGFSIEQVFGKEEEFGPIDQMIRFYLRPFTFFTFLFAIFYLRRARSNRALVYALALLAVVPAISLNFPFSTNRFYVFSIYLGLLIILFPPSPRNRTMYLLLLFAGIVGSSMVAAYFHASVGLGKEGFDFSYLTGLAFDAYESFVYSIDYVERNGITWGRQLLGGMLFWIPRELWPDKPVGTGGFVIEALHGARFTNVSSPLIEEAYINFWIPGVIVFSGLTGWFTARVHSRYKSLRSRSRNSRMPRGAEFYLVFYPVSVGFFLFVLRGDFMSSFAYLSGMVCSFLTVRIVVGRFAYVLSRVPDSSSLEVQAESH